MRRKCGGKCDHKCEYKCWLHSHSPTNDQPTLRPKFPQHNSNSKRYQTSLKFNSEPHFSISFKKLCSYYFATARLYLSESPSTCWRVYIQPHFVFSKAWPISLTTKRSKRILFVSRGSTCISWKEWSILTCCKVQSRKHWEKQLWKGRPGSVKPRVVTQTWVTRAFW